LRLPNLSGGLGCSHWQVFTCDQKLRNIIDRYTVALKLDKNDDKLFVVMTTIKIIIIVVFKLTHSLTWTQVVLFHCHTK